MDAVSVQGIPIPLSRLLCDRRTGVFAIRKIIFLKQQLCYLREMPRFSAAAYSRLYFIKRVQFSLIIVLLPKKGQFRICG
jgi:hypothetical protein